MCAKYQIIKLTEGEAFLTSSVEIWNFEDKKTAEDKFEAIVSSIKDEYNLYETFDEYKVIMEKYYNIEATEEDFERELMQAPMVKRLTPTEVFFDIDDIVIRLVLTEVNEHKSIDIA